MFTHSQIPILESLLEVVKSGPYLQQSCCFDVSLEVSERKVARLIIHSFICSLIHYPTNTRVHYIISMQSFGNKIHSFPQGTHSLESTLGFVDNYNQFQK